ncbi:hypothetical protein JCM15765_38460 [Paradesulfitobacterium aromaticivorans]
MKRTILIISVAILLLGGLGAAALSIDNPLRPGNLSAEPPEADLAFAVLGDIHGNTDSFQEAIKDLHKINPALDTLVLNGDTVDQGIDKQYDSITKVLAKNKSLQPQTIIKNIGNHEFHDYEQGKVNSPADVEAFIGRYLAFAGEDKVYHDTWINGYHFISLGSEDGNSNTTNSTRAYLSQTQLKWFQDKLAEKYETGKPIFVFLHQHLDNTNGWIGVDPAGAKVLREILSRYPEAVLFTSHTHRQLDQTSVKLNQPFTMVHTGAINYTIIPDSTGKGGMTRESLIQGLYVEVKGNEVTIKGRDIKKTSWIFTQELNGP